MERARQRTPAQWLRISVRDQHAHAGFDTQEDGVVAKILVDAGVAVPVGRPVAVLVESKADVAAFADYAPGAAAATPDTESEASSSSSSSSSDDAASAGAAARASSGPWAERLGPAARMALALRGLSASDVVATGPRGMLTKADVLAAKAPAEAPQRAPAQQLSAAAPAKPQKAAPAPEPPAQAESTGGAPPGRVQRGVERYTDAPVSGMRRVIAKRLLESKLSIPAIYVAADVRLGPLTALRATLKTAGMRASVNDFVLKGAAKALRAVPAACAGWDAAREEGVRYEDVDISVAVATEGGLITPIVKGADGKSVAEIGAAVRDLAGARLVSMACVLHSWSRRSAEWVPHGACARAMQRGMTRPASLNCLVSLGFRAGPCARRGMGCAVRCALAAHRLQACAHRQAARTCRPRARQQARAARVHRRKLHCVQPRNVRRARVLRHHQPAAGVHPGCGRAARAGAPRARRRRRRRRGGGAECDDGDAERRRARGGRGHRRHLPRLLRVPPREPRAAAGAVSACAAGRAAACACRVTRRVRAQCPQPRGWSLRAGYGARCCL